MANGTNTPSVIASCMIFSCGSESSVKPMRFAGTIRRYSKSAMPQLARAAIHHALEDRFLRCAYQAKVMNTLDARSIRPQVKVAESCISVDPFDFLVRTAFEVERQLWRDLQQRLQHEGALAHAGMGNHEVARGTFLLSVEQQIEIEGARRVGDAPHAPMAVLERLQLREKLFGGKAGFKRRNGVDEIGLIGIA